MNLAVIQIFSPQQSGCVTDERNVGLGCEELYKPGRLSWLPAVTQDSVQTVGHCVFQGDFNNITRTQQFSNFHFVNFPLAEGSFVDSEGP